MATQHTLNGEKHESTLMEVGLAVSSTQKDSELARYSVAEQDIPLSLDPSDPRNWPMWLKVVTLLQVSLLAGLGGMNTAIINPALVPMAKDLHITSVRASYQTTIVIAVNGIAPFIWIPLANVYGRRPVYLMASVIGTFSSLGCGYVHNYGQLLVARFFNGLNPVAFSLGAATVMDLFAYEQRGRAMGVFAVMMTNGSHLAPIVGGLIGQYLGWRWTFKFTAICDAVMLIVCFFCLPETLDHRSSMPPSTPRSYRYLLRLWSTHSIVRLRARAFVLPALRMTTKPSVLFPALYYAAQYGFASILPAVTVASIFSKAFGWDTLQIGLGYGTALTVGSFLGELCAGNVIDRIVRGYERREGKKPDPEIRLKAIWTGEIVLPAGLLIYGFGLAYKLAWPVPLVGMGIACFGLQIITTTCYTYSIDCHGKDSAEVSQVFNFWRQELGMTFAFYVIPFAEKVGYQWVFVFFAVCGSILGFVPILMLMRRGKDVRLRWG